MSTVFSSSAFFVITALLGVSAQGADITVLLINTQTGQPMSGQRIWLRPARQRTDDLPNEMYQRTGPDGTAVFRFSEPSSGWINVFVNDVTLWQCSPWSKSKFSVKETVEHGAVALNRCDPKGKLKGITAKPGEVVIFTRPLHWWEKGQE